MFCPSVYSVSSVGSISNPVSMDGELLPPPWPSFPYLALWNKQTENLLLLGFCIWGWHLSPGICHWQVQSQFVYPHQIQSLCRPESTAYKQKQGVTTISIHQNFLMDLVLSSTLQVLRAEMQFWGISQGSLIKLLAYPFKNMHPVSRGRQRCWGCASQLFVSKCHVSFGLF